MWVCREMCFLHNVWHSLGTQVSVEEPTQGELADLFCQQGQAAKKGGDIFSLGVC